jgi:hypothetical protein
MNIKTIFHIIGSWSASTSPARSPLSPRSRSGINDRHHRNGRRNHLSYRFGTTSLMQRSRSPSPTKYHDYHSGRYTVKRNEMGTISYFKTNKSILTVLSRIL